MNNVTTAATDQALSDAAAAMGDTSHITFDAKTPATYGTATARVTSRSFGRITPFASGGGGIAHLTPDVSAVASGVDVTSQFEEAIGSAAPATKPLLVAGGGVSFATSRRSAIDVEYRYDRIFTDTAINTNRVVASMRVGF
jgi:opacity protein-like surface antigen